MKFITLDVETTGIDFENNQILEIGAVIEDTNTKLPIEELPKFKCILYHPIYKGSAYAIHMNSRIFTILAEYESQQGKILKSEFAEKHSIFSPERAAGHLIAWISNYDSEMLKQPLNFAGKNYSVFDKLFVERLPNWNDLVKVHRRYIDPTMLFVDWKNDKCLPDLNTCMSRAGIKSSVTHDALQDAIDTLKCLRTNY